MKTTVEGLFVVTLPRSTIPCAVNANLLCTQLQKLTGHFHMPVYLTYQEKGVLEDSFP